MKKTTHLAAHPAKIFTPVKIDNINLNRSVKALGRYTEIRRNEDSGGTNWSFIVITGLVIGGIGYMLGQAKGNKECLSRE